ncbi:Zinc/iron permease [Pavlovales sp. CCMP2436]|nr:Zinc/iron permease [Pavlovales sp. CCMP2436]
MPLPTTEVELLVRCVFAASLAGVAFVGVRLPTRMPKRSRLMPIANAFGGGVILSAALVHLLPEASGCTALGSFPWGPTCLAMGYLFLLSIEISVDRFAQSSSMHSLSCCRLPLMSANHTCGGSPLQASDDSDEPYTQVETGSHLLEQKQGCSGTHTHMPPVREDSCASRGGIRQQHERRPLAAVAATCGLSVHAILEGLALGLRSNTSDFVALGALIGLHKLFAAFALGAVLADGPSKRMQKIATFLFIAATPAGIVVGSALLVSTTCTVTAPMSAFSAGSLVWVALHEVISPATASTVDIAAVLCALWLGFGAMTVLAVWV